MWTTNLISLMRAGGDALQAAGDDAARDYALHAAANHMILLLNGDVSLDEFRAAYVTQGATPIDLDKRFPVREEAL